MKVVVKVKYILNRTSIIECNEVYFYQRLDIESNEVYLEQRLDTQNNFSGYVNFKKL